MKQSLATAYSVKRKPKKMAKGGIVKGKNDEGQIRRNSGDKAPKDDSWGSNITVKQAQKPSITKLSQPKMVGSDVFSVRNRDMHDDEADMMDRIHPESDLAQPVKRDDEQDAKKMGKGPDMAAQHDNKKAPYNKAIEDQYAQDMAAAEMKKAQSYAQGGPVMEPEDHHEELMERSDEAHMMDMESPSEDEGDAEAHSLNEEGPNRPGPHVSALDMKKMARGGRVSPMDELEEEHHDSIAAAIMARKDREKMMSSDSDDDKEEDGIGKRDGLFTFPKKMAKGGAVNGKDSIYPSKSSQADLSRNAEEDANMEDQSSFDALRKENYSESEGLSQLDSPMDSNEHGHELTDEDAHDMVASIRRKIAAKRQFGR